jgi:thioredoxin 1
MAMKITADNFEAEVLNAEVPVLVDFWADWCNPCKMLSPVVDEIAEESDKSYKVGKINVDEEQDLAAKFRVMSIPTLIVFEKGEETQRSVGVQPKSQILSMLGK